MCPQGFCSSAVKSWLSTCERYGIIWTKKLPKFELII